MTLRTIEWEDGDTGEIRTAHFRLPMDGKRRIRLSEFRDVEVDSHFKREVDKAWVKNDVKHLATAVRDGIKACMETRGVGRKPYLKSLGLKLGWLVAAYNWPPHEGWVPPYKPKARVYPQGMESAEGEYRRSALMPERGSKPAASESVLDDWGWAFGEAAAFEAADAEGDRGKVREIYRDAPSFAAIRMVNWAGDDFDKFMALKPRLKAEVAEVEAGLSEDEVDEETEGKMDLCRRLCELSEPGVPWVEV